MDLRQLRNFVAIVDFGSLTQAAIHLGVAQPALSQQLTTLETDCRVQLLVRSFQGVTPTEAGRVLYRHARTVLRQIDEARQEMLHGAPGLSGQVAVGLPTTTALILAVPLLKAVRERHPGIRLQLFESLSGYLTELLANGRLDLALLFRDIETRTVAREPLLLEPLFIIGEVGGAGDAPGGEECSLRELRGVKLVLPSKAHELRLTIERAFAREGIEPNVIADVDSLPTMISAAVQGFACTILPASALSSVRMHGRETPARRIVSPDIRRPISLCWLDGPLRSPAAIAVQALVIDLVRDLARSGTWPGVTVPAPPP